MNVLTVVPPRRFQVTASEEYRAINPTLGLRLCGHDARIAHADELTQQLVAWADVVSLVRVRPSSVAEYDKMVDAADRMGQTIAVDVDDDEWALDDSYTPPDVIDRPTALGLFEHMVRRAHLVTVTTPALRTRMRQMNERVEIVPNVINLARWPSVELEREPPPVVGVQGGASHFRDWQVLEEAWALLHERHPEVRFKVAGSCPPYLDRFRFAGVLDVLPWAAVDRYAENVAEIDIACCPLPDTPFNRCKSPIKFFESSMCSAACVVSPVVYGSVVGDSAVIARYDAAEWAYCLEWLVEDEPFRLATARSARERVQAFHALDAGFGKAVEAAYGRSE